MFAVVKFTCDVRSFIVIRLVGEDVGGIESPIRDGLIEGEKLASTLGRATTLPPVKDTTLPAKARPVMTTLSPNVTDSNARILPMKVLFAPIIAVEPTLQKTFCASAPFISTIDDKAPVVRSDEDLNIQTEAGLF